MHNKIQSKRLLNADRQRTMLTALLFFALTCLPGNSPLHAAEKKRIENEAAKQQAAKQQAAKQASQKRKDLFAALKKAKTEQEGRKIEHQIWQFWLRRADITSRALVMDAMSMRATQNYDHAMKLLNSAIRIKPDYAEAYNQRSFIHFLQNNLEKSLIDSRRALELEPKHFGALAGQAHIFMRQGRVKLMQAALRRAVSIHPWIQERHLLAGKSNHNRQENGQPL